MAAVRGDQKGRNSAAGPAEEIYPDAPSLWGLGRSFAPGGAGELCLPAAVLRFAVLAARTQIHCTFSPGKPAYFWVQAQQRFLSLMYLCHCDQQSHCPHSRGHRASPN